jgi:hypothetical protein
MSPGFAADASLYQTDMRYRGVASVGSVDQRIVVFACSNANDCGPGYVCNFGSCLPCVEHNGPCPRGNEICCSPYDRCNGVGGNCTSPF